MTKVNKEELITFINKMIEGSREQADHFKKEKERNYNNEFDRNEAIENYNFVRGRIHGYNVVLRVLNDMEFDETDDEEQAASDMGLRTKG